MKFISETILSAKFKINTLCFRMNRNVLKQNVMGNKHGDNIFSICQKILHTLHTL